MSDMWLLASDCGATNDVGAVTSSLLIDGDPRVTLFPQYFL